MDAHRFDALTRSLSSARTRRGVLTGLAGLVVGVRRVGRAGAAPTPCPPGQKADKKGVCRCPAGTDPCPTGCFALKRDVKHCGGCGIACRPGEICQKGVCRCPRDATCCPAGQVPCAGACLTPDQLLTDANNCGVCGGVCGPDQACVNGVCVPACDGPVFGEECTTVNECCTGGAPVQCASVYIVDLTNCCRPLGTACPRDVTPNCCAQRASDGITVATDCSPGGICGGLGAFCSLEYGGLTCISGSCCEDPSMGPDAGVCC